MPSLEDEIRGWEEMEHRLLTLMAEAERRMEYVPENDRLRLAAHTETVRREWQECKATFLQILAEDGDDA